MSSTSSTPPSAAPSLAAGIAAAAQANKTGTKKIQRDSQSAPQPQPSESEETQSPLFNTKPELPISKLDQAAIAELLKTLSVDSFENQLEGEESITKAHQDQLTNIHKRNLHKLHKIMKKHHKRNIGALVGEILGWTAAALGIIVSVVLIGVSLGTGSPVAAAMISLSLALAVTMIALEASGGMDKMTEGLAGEFEKILVDCGVDANKAKLISKIMAQVTIAAIVLGMQIGLTVLSGGANAENMANQMMQRITKIATISARVAMAASAAAQAGAAGAETATAVYAYEEAELQADMVDNRAMMTKLQALMEDQQETIREIMQVLMGTQENMGQMVRDENDSRGKLANLSTRAAV